jgi:hypothetical protein
MELRGITKRLKADHKSQDRRDEPPGRGQTHLEDVKRITEKA